MTREEIEVLQEAIETAVIKNRRVCLPEFDQGISLRFAYHKFCLDGVYWKGDEGEIYSIYMEIEYRKGGIWPGLYVIGTYTPNNFSSGNLKMIRKENRYFSEYQNDTNYIESIPKLKEKILDSANIPISECIPESEIDWGDPVGE